MVQIVAMARSTFHARSVEALPFDDDAHSNDRLRDDRIDFDAWLLPPEVPTRGERIIRFWSTASGPIVFGVALAAFVGWIA